MAKLIRVWDGSAWQSVGVAAAQGELTSLKLKFDIIYS